MPVRARWQSAAPVADPSFDPFAMPSSAVMCGSPTPIDLSTPEPVLMDRLQSLIRREGNLDACGTSCSMKNEQERNSCCLSCPFSLADAPYPDAPATDDEAAATARQIRLCQIGREQQEIVAVLHSRTAADG